MTSALGFSATFGVPEERGRWRPRSALAGAAALALLLAACGDDGGDAGSDGTGADAAEASEAESDGAGSGDAGESATEVTAPTIDELVTGDEPLNIAHAGGDAEWPHSTLYAFGEAAEAGADMLEMDVWLSADGVVMVHHDDTVDRITEEEGPIGDFTAAELRELDAAYWFSPGHWDGREAGDDTDYPLRGVRTGDTEPPEGYGPDDFIIPTLAEVATTFPGLPLDIEIKGEGETAAETAAALADELEDLDRLDSVVVTSFDQPTVDTFRELAPTVELSPGIDDLVAWYAGEGDLDGYRVLQVPPEYGDIEVVTAENLDLMRGEDPGMQVWVWMTSIEEDTEEHYQDLLDRGVDGIITARPSEFPR